MKKDGRAMVLGLLVATLLLMPLTATHNAVFIIEQPIEEKAVEKTTHNGGWFEERDGVKILHLNGSYYDMGYQHGYLLKEEIQGTFKQSLSSRLACLL